MAVVVHTPRVEELTKTAEVLRGWQSDDAPMQLHPGDIGWFWRFGADATAAAVRTWSRDGRVVAVGLLDAPTVLRLTLAPDQRRDERLAHQIADDLSDPARGVLMGGRVSVEAPRGAVIRDVLSDTGWRPAEPWTPLRRELAASVPDPGVRVEVIGPEQAAVRVAVQRAAFENSTFTVERWNAMADGVLYSDARCLVAYDGRGAAVAAVTVWSAGPGRPGLLEPMGVHREHRGRGYGTAITLAGAAALRTLGSSSALVCTPSANVAGVAAYVSAGFEQLAEVPDLCRDAEPN